LSLFSFFGGKLAAAPFGTFATLSPQQQTFEAEEASGANTMQYGRIFATLGAPVRAARVTEAAGRKT
jgi:hypothetical protein